MYEKINKFSVTRDNAWPAPYSLCLSESRARINHLLSLLRLPASALPGRRPRHRYVGLAETADSPTLSPNKER